MTARLLLASLVSLMLAAATASAEPADTLSAPGVTQPTVPPAHVPAGDGGHGRSSVAGETEWYGAPIILVDLLAVGVTALALNSESDDVLYAAAATMTLGGPIVHLTHGQQRNAAMSLGLRVGLPVLGGLLGYASAGNCYECHSTHGLFEALGGIAIGTVAASVIDIAVVARARGSRERAETTAWVPQLGIGDSHVTAGVVGWF